jgi:uncharacterized repeat protein (TIGR03803 family)
MAMTIQHQRYVGALGLAATSMLAALLTPPAQAQTYTVLHRFTGADGARPAATLIADPAGSLFGTTYAGGVSGYGTVFKLDKTGLTVLHSFTGGADGGTLLGSLVRDSAGNLYGTTESGGAGGLGTVFKLDATGTETVLHSFAGGSDGANPHAGLIRDAAGNLYGTTKFGGPSGDGVVFKVDKSGERVLHSFTGTDGAKPAAALIQDSAGNLYGTTSFGGAAGAGTVFKLDTTGTETVLYSFSGGADGSNPFGLIQDSSGNLYGTTIRGGIAPGLSG